MKIARLLALPAALGALSLTAAQEITITPDKADHLYKCGETATFTVRAADGDKLLNSGSMVLNITRDGGDKLAAPVVDFAQGNPVKVTAKLEQPGFIRVHAGSFKGLAMPKQPIMAGVGYEPEKIKMGNDLPADFMKFWEDGRKMLAGDTIHLAKLDKFSTAKVTSYRVTVDALNGDKIYGFLAVPNGKGPFPAWVTVPGAGPGAPGPNGNLAATGVIALTMNVHKFDGAMNAEELRKQYADANKARGYSYSVDQAQDRDKFHFRSVILAVDRAINYVAAMPQWDKKHFVINGSSQGGAMALTLTGFNKNITACAANVPAMCDHGGNKLGRQSGWPGLHRVRPASVTVSPYFDAANFAKFITVPVLTSAGFIDTTCPPSSVYAAYNEVKAPKKIIHVTLEGHTVSKVYSSYQGPWVKGQLGLTAPTEPTAKK